MNPPSLSELGACVKQLPLLPEVIRHFLDDAAEHSDRIAALEKQLSTDPVISNRIVYAAHAVAPSLSTSTHSLKHALLILGADRATSIILGSVAAMLASKYNINYPGFNARWIWKHSTGVAICAQVIAERIPLNFNKEITYAAGLLHDIGQLLMFTASHESYLKSLLLRDAKNISLSAAEREVFGYDHTEAGVILAKMWQLPELIIEGIRFHHSPEKINRDMAKLIHISEILSHALDLGERPNNRVPDLCDNAYLSLNIHWAELASSFAEIETRFAAARSALKS